MARYIGPKARVSRRLGVNLFGTPRETRALDRRPYPPGEHGRSRRRNPSEYLVQLQEKQKARYTYGVLERQFRRYYREATRSKGVTGETLLQLLERRLDNVVYRSGWGSTRPQARQFVNHGHISVNGRRVNVPSYRVRQGDVVELGPKARDMVQIRWNMDVLDRQPPAWLTAGDGGQQVTVTTLPTRDQIDVPVREQLIIELYSK
jgi:small subunit ribosomal protein S4